MISVNTSLPPLGRYVLVHTTRDNWIDHRDQEGVNFVVAMRVACENDSNPNNLKDYKWEQFGPGSFFGQEVDFWKEIDRSQFLPQKEETHDGRF